MPMSDDLKQAYKEHYKKAGALGAEMAATHWTTVAISAAWVRFLAPRATGGRWKPTYGQSFATVGLVGVLGLALRGNPDQREKNKPRIEEIRLAGEALTERHKRQQIREASGYRSQPMPSPGIFKGKGFGTGDTFTTTN